MTYTSPVRNTSETSGRQLDKAVGKKFTPTRLLTQRLLGNRLAMQYFNTHGGETSLRNHDEFFNNLPPVLSAEMEPIDKMAKDNPEALYAETKKIILDFVNQTGQHLIGITQILNETSPTLIENFFALSNGECDLGRLCDKFFLQIIKNPGGQESITAFRAVYTVLRAGEAKAEPQNTNPITPPPKAVTVEYLDQDTRGSLMFIYKRVRTIATIKAYGTFLVDLAMGQYPQEIRATIVAGIEGLLHSFKLEDTNQRAKEFIQETCRDRNISPEDTLHVRQEVFDRTFGTAASLISVWTKKQELPNLDELQSALETGLICLNYFEYING